LLQAGTKRKGHFLQFEEWAFGFFIRN